MNKLQPQQQLLALIIVLGGLIVLASYALIPGYSAEVRAGLWGEVPEGLRPLYGISMLLAAAGFFPFTYHLVFRQDPNDFAAAVGLPYSSLYGIYGLIFIPSALWVPLTASMLQSPSELLWQAIRADLALVALGSTLLFVVLGLLAFRRGGTLARASVVAVVPFWFQTAILDGVVWPAYFPVS